MQVSADESGDRSQCWICVWDIMNILMGPKQNCEYFFFLNCFAFFFFNQDFGNK